MRIQLRFLIGIIILLRLKSTLGDTSNSCNCSCFLQPKGDDVCELIREVKTKTDNMVIFHEAFSDKKLTVNSELHTIIDERIKAYMEGNNISCEKQKEEKTNPNEKSPNVDALSNHTEQNNEKSEMKQRIEGLERKYEELYGKHDELERKYEELERKSRLFRRVIHQVLTKMRFLERAEEHPYKGRIETEKNELIELESRIEEIAEFLCIFIIDTQRRIEASSLFRTNLWISNLCSSKIFGSQKLSTPVTYRELDGLEAACPGLDRCEDNRNSDSLIQYNCQCGPLCSTFDTCCFDSPFLGLPSNNDPSQSCQTVYGASGSAYFMVDRCPRNATAGDVWKTLCSKGGGNNFMAYVPVTSNITGITYKNYYCLACHETTHNYHVWEAKVHSQNEIATHGGNPLLVFDSASNEWMGVDTNTSNNKSIVIIINKPSEIKHHDTECRKGIISTCRDDWPDNITIVKCNSYTSIISIRDSNKRTLYRTYKNPHCAVCNFESLDNIYCNKIESQDFPFSVSPKSLDYDDDNFKSPFSYTLFFLLIPLNCHDNYVWNPFSKECSPLECSEGYSLKNRVCIPS